MDPIFVEQSNDYYATKLSQYGDSILGLDWNSVAAQETRFEQITKIIDHEVCHFSICDYGCGFGDYQDYLSKRYPAFDYYGFDINKEMIRFAKARHPDTQFYVGSQLNADFDYLGASGIFNLKQSISDDKWFDYIIETLNMFHQHTKKGFAFNCLTKYSDQDRMKDYLYYADPLMLFDYCKRNFSRNVALLHDYTLYDFTILVRKGNL